MDRDTIFISHATPDDNEFVRWLGGELTARGYAVWADVFHLKGGTPFWTTIEDTLRKRAIKVIFVVSRGSIDPARGGVRNELSVADGLRKALKDPGFIVPVRIDDSPFDELPIQVHQLNTLDFSADWTVRLPDLLDTLEVAMVPRSGEAGAPPSIARSGAVVDDTRSTEPMLNAVYDRASIAVLPFDNISSDPDQDYFADGVVEDVITALSRFKTFAVVARNSSFVYKGRAVDVRTAAKELGVRYILEGSVRRGGARVRVTAQLIDADTGKHIWAERFDGGLEDVFDVQDKITESVIGLIEPQIRKIEIERTRRKRPDSLDAYDLMLRAGPLVLGTDLESYTEAIDLLHRAVALDPGYALAYALCGWAHEKRYTFNVPVPEGTDDRALAIEMSERALALDRDDAAVLAIAAWNVVLLKRDFERGVSLADRAVELNPNHLTVLNFAGLCCAAAGHLERSAVLNRRALRLSPGAPDAYWTLTMLATGALLLGNAEEAIDWCQKAIAVNGGWEVTWMMIAAAYAKLGRTVEARHAVERLVELNPLASTTNAKTMPLLPHHAEIIRENLVKAGLRQE